MTAVGRMVWPWDLLVPQRSGRKGFAFIGGKQISGMQGAVGQPIGFPWGQSALWSLLGGTVLLPGVMSRAPWGGCDYRLVKSCQWVFCPDWSMGTISSLIIYETKNRSVEGPCLALSKVNKGAALNLMKSQGERASLQWAVSWNTKGGGFPSFFSSFLPFFLFLSFLSFFLSLSLSFFLFFFFSFFLSFLLLFW